MKGPNGEDLPDAVLFACTFNAVRSPMAAALFRHLYGKFTYVDSAGVKTAELDPLAVEALGEIGIDIHAHKPKTFEELEDASFDLIVSLSPEAHHKALEFTRAIAVEAEYWPTFDLTAQEGTREQRLEAYRGVRDGLLKRIKARFAPV
ncbi:MAG: arsenate reductase ArsC [Alphaproteobacteria bacterium]|nr:arsenate reductase ArsC [Alphaproteobacteria bacterium]